MEPLESAVGQTCKVANREKKTEESVAVSASNISAKRTTFADSKAKGYAKQQGSQRCSAEEHFGKELSSAGSQSSQEKQCSLRLSRSYSYRLRHSNQQKPKQKGSLTGAKPTADLEVLASSLASPLQLSASEHRGDLTCKNSPHVPTAFTQTSQSRIEQLGGMLRKVPKSKNPGKYICHYCGRACAKPSVLKKHIRSHTGERPYPCIPCGFSFKTKSNLYKHKKSHAHNVKAGLAPFSEQSAACKGADQSSLAGEPGVHSDSEQSTDTDEEAAMFLNKGGPVPCISLTAERSALASGPDGSQSAEELIVTSKEVAIVVASEPGIPCTAPECPWITDVNISGHRSSGDEFPTIKQKLALRLTGKKRQESGPSMDLLSPHSKGSTDSGYFSRSESAEQQISPPNTNAKSYEEIMFGKFYKLGPRSRHAITMAMPKATGADQNLVNTQDKSDTMPGSGICKTSEYHKSCYHTKDEKLLNPVHQNVATFLGDNRDSQMKISSLSRQYHPSFCQITTGPVDAADAGPLVRSNSVPMAPVGSLSAPQGLQGSHSFDERMTSDPGFYRSSVGLRRLRRQAAFEFIAHEGHVEFDNSGTNSKSIFSPAGLVQLDENSPSLPNLKGHSSYSGGVEGQPEPLAQVRVTHHKQVTEIATRKRRKKKSVGDEEDFPVQHDNDFDSSVEMLAVDYDSKQEHQDAFRRAFSGTGQLYSVHREPENLSTGTCVAPDETVLISDVDRKTGGNVISVIQHTNSLSRPSSFEKSDSIDQAFLPLNTLTTQYSEQSDSEKPGEMHGADPKRSGNAEPRQVGGEPADHSYRLPHKLVRQANIQVPEIRVTEEPDKPIEGRDASIKESEKQVEDFQWPQRSETLSQLPAEKLPPKKKRLRLAEMEHSSGESSFESTCSSLSRSPSQESHLSPSSSFSMSFDREESGKSASPAKQDDFGKQSEFLTVPCSGRSLPVRNQSRQKEVRRSSSEQAACVLHSELPEIRSKSFDYGGLLSSSSLGDVHAGALAMTERRRGCLVRQAPLSIYPESPTQDKASDTKVKEERPERSSSPLLHSRWLSTASPDKTNSSPAYDVALSRKTEDGQRGGGMQKQRMSHLLEHGRSQSDRWAHEVPSKEFMQNINVGKSPALPSQSAAFCQSESIQMQYLPRVPWSLSDLLSRAFTGSTGLLKPVQTVISHELAGSQPPPPDTSVPVRIQTQVPSHCSIMYTNVPQVVVTHSQSNSSVMAICHVRDNTLLTKSGSKDGVCHSLSNHGELVHYPLGKLQEAVPARMNTGIPLTLTSGTISTTDASGTGGNKRILSPANSMELFIETKQQKRVKEEKMYGQIVEELSAVELSNSRVTKASGKSQKPGLKNHGSGDYPKRMSVSPLLHLPATAVTLPTAELHLQEVGDIREGMQSPESLDIDDSSPPAAEIQEMMDCKIPLNILMETAANQDAILASTLLLTDVGNDKNFAQFPSLCTSTSVSWCFLNYTKPNTAQTCSVASVYGSWFVSSYNPNPPDLNTKTSLALLRSKQKKTTESYTVASMHQPGTGKVVSSLLWKQKFEKEKPEVMQLDVNKFEKKTKEVGVRERLSEGHRHKEASPKVAEPNRIKIFEGGYKSNEEYVYVRGRGRGKYICEECGIRCKKPSMLKKHIRTHTDVRPYVCKFCNFAFKTKGNLTKHMKSKAHMKKCVELGVSLTSVETTEAEEGDNADEGQRASWKSVRTGVITEHQFSDADDSEEAEEEADENEEDDDEDDEYEGDSTPRTRSRSTSPQPSGTPSVPVTASAVSPGTSSDLPYPAARAPLFGLSDIQLKRRGDRVCKAQMAEGQRSTQGVTSDEHEKSLNVTGSLDKACAPSQECSFPTTDFAPSSVASLGYDSSPQREPSPAPQRYLSPLRELLPQGHLRHVSPKKDISIRRGFSPRGHSSTDPLARPVSPGRDISCKRELSPRSRHCGSIRPVSPRRGMYHHGAPWSQGPNLQSELATVEKLDGHSDVNMEPRKSSLQSCRHLGEDHRSLAPPSPQQGLFSHLPLHSQVLVRTPVSTVPIGGIQMVPAAPLSAAGLLKSTLGESGLGAMPFCRSEASCKAGGNPPGMPDSPPSPAPQGEHVDVGDITDRVDAPDENVQICTKAIASLRISSEDAAAERSDGPPPSSLATHPHVNS